MKLDNDVITLIKSAVKTAHLVGIEQMIIEQGRIRAVDINKTVLLCHTENIPELPFETLGLSRLNIFSSRLSILETRDKMSIDARLRDGTNVVHSLQITGEGTKVDFACANPEKIEAPKGIGEEYLYRIALTPEAVMMMSKAQSAMDTDLVTIISNENGVSFEMVDSTNDIFSFKFTDDVTVLQGDLDTFVYRYPIKTLLSLFKQDTEASFDIGQHGVLRYNVNGLNVMVFPKV